MSSNMNSRSITDYILKLEKDLVETKKQRDCDSKKSRTKIKQLEKDLIGSEIRRVSDVISEADQYKSTVDKLKKENSESRTKIEQLKKLYAQAEDEKVDALSALTDFKYKTNCLSKSSYTDSTARVCGKSPYCKTRANSVIVERLLELGEMTSDFYKTGAYHCAADTIAKLEYVVESGESVRHLSGIGKSISAKIDECLEEEDSDYEASECSDSESIASNDLSEEVSNTHELFSSSDDDVSEASSYDDYRVTFHTNVIIADELANLGALEKCAGASDWKVKAYTKAAKLIDNLTHEVLNGTDLMKLDGIGQGIADKVDEIIQYGTTRRANDLKHAYPDKCN